MKKKSEIKLGPFKCICCERTVREDHGPHTTAWDEHRNVQVCCNCYTMLDQIQKPLSAFLREIPWPMVHVLGRIVIGISDSMEEEEEKKGKNEDRKVHRKKRAAQDQADTGPDLP
jgi:hypothetical protein